MLPYGYSADDSKISNRTINMNRISNRTYDSKSNRITKLRRSLHNAYKLNQIKLKPDLVAFYKASHARPS